MRIVAGKFRGASIEAPKGVATRPTSDRVRQALFNVLQHGAPEFDFEGARVLDLFAGSGALGLEALSRGARYAVFIEENAAAARRSGGMLKRLDSPASPRSGAATRRGSARPARFSPSSSSSATRLTARASENARLARRLIGGGLAKERSPSWKSGPMSTSPGPLAFMRSIGDVMATRRSRSQGLETKAISALNPRGSASCLNA